MKTDTLKTIRTLLENKAKDGDIADFLTNNLTSKELVEQLVEMLKEKYETPEPSLLRISQSDFDRHFRIIGMRSDGQPETRGRKMK